jgi:hypothetical protein
MYTCKVVAQELKGLALRENTIIFRTFRDAKAQHIDHLLSEQTRSMHKMLDYTREMMTSEVLHDLKKTHPHSSTLRNLLKVEEDSWRQLRYNAAVSGNKVLPSDGEPYSVVRHVARERCVISAPIAILEYN